MTDPRGERKHAHRLCFPVRSGGQRTVSRGTKAVVWRQENKIKCVYQNGVISDVFKNCFNFMASQALGYFSRESQGENSVLRMVKESTFELRFHESSRQQLSRRRLREGRPDSQTVAHSWSCRSDRCAAADPPPNVKASPSAHG